MIKVYVIVSGLILTVPHSKDPILYSILDSGGTHHPHVSRVFWVQKDEGHELQATSPFWMKLQATGKKGPYLGSSDYFPRMGELASASKVRKECVSFAELDNCNSKSEQLVNGILELHGDWVLKPASDCGDGDLPVAVTDLATSYFGNTGKNPVEPGPFYLRTLANAWIYQGTVQDLESLFAGAESITPPTDGEYADQRFCDALGANRLPCHLLWAVNGPATSSGGSMVDEHFASLYDLLTPPVGVRWVPIKASSEKCVSSGLRVGKVSAAALLAEPYGRCTGGGSDPWP